MATVEGQSAGFGERTDGNRLVSNPMFSVVKSARV